MVSIQAHSNLIVFTCLNNFIFDAMIKYKDYFLYNIFFLLEIRDRIHLLIKRKNIASNKY